MHSQAIVRPNLKFAGNKSDQRFQIFSFRGGRGKHMPLHVAHATVLPINPSGNRTVIYYVTGKSTTRSVEYMSNRGAAHGKDDAAPYVACLQVAQSANRCAEHIISCVQRSTRAEHGDAPIDSWAWALESQSPVCGF